MKDNLEKKILSSEKNFSEKGKIFEIKIGDQEFFLQIGEENSLDFKNKKIFLTEDFIENFGGDEKFSAEIFYFNKISQIISNGDLVDSKFFLSAFFKKEEKNILDSRLRGNDRGKDGNNRRIENKFGNVNNPSNYSIYLQMFFLSIFNEQNISFEVQDLLEKDLRIGEKNMKFFDFLKLFVEQFSQFDLQENFEKKTLGKEINSDLQKKLSSFKFILEQNGIYEILENLEKERNKKNNLNQKKEEKKEEKQKDKKIEQIKPSNFQEKYDPKDSIKEENEAGEIQVIGSFDPPVTGYFKEYSMDDFGNDLKWKVDTSKLEKFEGKKGEIFTIYSTILNPGLNPIPCPYGFEVLDFDFGENEILQNSDGNFFINSKKGGEVKISFGKIGASNFPHPSSIPKGEGITRKEKLENFGPETKIGKFISERVSEGKNNSQILSEIKEKILNKYYSTEYQGSFVEKSSSKKDYFDNLFVGEKMECYSANTLFVAIARHLGFEAKLSVGFNSNLKKGGKSYISANDGHAWAEIKINGKWQIEDVTPINSDDEKDGEESEENSDDEKDLEENKKDFKNNSDELDKFDKKDLEDLKNEILKNSEEISDELREMFDEGFDLKSLKNFEKILSSVKIDAKKLTQKIKKLLEIKILEREKKEIETVQKSSKINIKKIIKDFPEIGLGLDSDAGKNAMQKVLNGKYYLKNKSETKEVIDFPDEIRFSFALDLSGSMDDGRKERLNNYLILFREAFSSLYREFKNKKVDLKLDVYAFGGETQKIISDLTLNKDKKSKSQIIQAVEFAQKNSLGGNDEEELYSKIISEKEKIKIENERKPENKQKKSVNIGITITDEETFTPDSISKLLGILDQKYQTPFVAINVGGGRTNEMMSGYSYGINDGELAIDDYIGLIGEILEERI